MAKPDYAVIKIVPKAQVEEQQIPRPPECDLKVNDDVLECAMKWRRQWCLLAGHGDAFMYRVTDDKYNYVIPEWCMNLLQREKVVSPN